jgi:small subunit ribosomal protein S17
MVNGKEINTERSLVLEGEVISDKMQKTVVVKVFRTLKHPTLGKTVRLFKKYKAHDESESSKCGDWVEIAECRPLSKTKHMVLNRVIRVAR